MAVQETLQPLRRGKIDLALLGSTQPIRDDELTSEILIEKIHDCR